MPSLLIAIAAVIAVLAVFGYLAACAGAGGWLSLREWLGG